MSEILNLDSLVELSAKLKQQYPEIEDYWNYLLVPTNLSFSEFDARISFSIDRIMQRHPDLFADPGFKKSFNKEVAKKLEITCLGILLLTRSSDRESLAQSSPDYYLGFLFGVVSEFTNGLIMKSKDEAEMMEDLKKPSNS